MRALRLSAPLLLTALLAGCGGGSGSVVSAPPPPSGENYPGQANANVTAPTLNESFTNDAARGSATISGGTLGGISVGTASLTVRYDASDNGYTLSANAASFAFARSALSPLAGTPFVTATNSATGDAVVLLNHTMVNLTYVDTGYWLRAALNSQGNGTVAVTAFSYGVETPDNAVPRTGNATYNTGLLGIVTTGGLVYDARGGFQVTTDFGTGAMSLSGTLSRVAQDTANPVGTTIVNGTAALSSTTNRFSGTLSSTVPVSGVPLPPLTGTLEGRFFGPAAQEIGGVFQMQGQDTLVVGGFSGARVNP